jgi:two-component sensor histidine kinase
LAARRSATALRGCDAGTARQSRYHHGQVLDELITNAVKYGALSDPRGRIAVSWCMLPPPASADRVAIERREADEPP